MVLVAGGLILLPALGLEGILALGAALAADVSVEPPDATQEPTRSDLGRVSLACASWRSRAASRVQCSRPTTSPSS